MTHGSLFSGIGGFDLGFERAGIETCWQVESDRWCCKLLAKRFPNAKRFEEIREVGAENLEQVDIISGGFPCQPVSVAGKRQGDGDTRWLWPEMLRVVAALRPDYVVAENVLGLLSFEGGWLFEQVCTDLEAEDYETITLVLPACAFGAPHRRYRIWIVAHSAGERARLLSARSRSEGKGAPDTDRCGTNLADSEDTDRGRTNGTQITRWRNQEARRCDLGGDGPKHWAVEPDMGRVAHGIPARVDRLRGLGNAVVPQIAEWLARRILATEAEMKKGEG